MPASAFLSRQQPLLAERLAISNHGQRAVEARAAHNPAPEQLAVLRALGLRFEAHRVARHGRRVWAVAVLVAIARSRTKAAILEDHRIGIPFRLAAFKNDADEIAAIQHVHHSPPSPKEATPTLCTRAGLAAIRRPTYLLQNTAMVRLREQDFRAALDLLGAMSEGVQDAGSFARFGVERLPALVASEFTTLSVCNLVNGRREVYGMPAGALNADDRAPLDPHFNKHPLVRYHGYEGGRRTQRISDSVAFERFRHTALYNDYYRRIRIDHAIALPIYVRHGLLVSFVLNRTRRDFSDRERALLDLVGPYLAKLYEKAQTLNVLT